MYESVCHPSLSHPSPPLLARALAYLLNFAGPVVSAVSDLELVGVDGVVIVARVHAVHVLVAHQRRYLAEKEEDEDGAGHEPRGERQRWRRRREAQTTGLPRRRAAPAAGGARHASGGLFMELKEEGHFFREAGRARAGAASASRKVRGAKSIQ